MNGLLRTKAIANNIKISETEINNIAEKLAIKEVCEFAKDYNLSLEQARHDLAEYIVYNFKINE